MKAQGLEGLVAKRLGTRYEPGMQSGAWMKMRVNRGQEFVIGGYTLGTKTFDAIVFGYFEGKKLIYVARTRNGFTPATRLALFKKFAWLEIPECPFANLPEARSGRWGQGLTKAKMAECRWLKMSYSHRTGYFYATGGTSVGTRRRLSRDPYFVNLGGRRPPGLGRANTRACRDRQPRQSHCVETVTIAGIDRPSGVLSTVGGLVFRVAADGYLEATDDRS